ncbi:ATP synthase subunit I [Pseudaeromonas sp. ZJS20]|uniref:ATP synthase subunit I n=1 Tax=Pseudaeromonas aegiceratis TaxID=3153928 RepID=UPI00390C65DC
MDQNRQMSVQALAWIILIYQLVLIVVCSLAWYLGKGGAAAYSSLIGGGIYWVPQMLFSWIGTSRKSEELNVGLVLWDVYCGAGIKLVATLALFLIAFKWLAVVHLPLFVTYGVLLCSQWIISLTLNNRY